MCSKCVLFNSILQVIIHLNGVTLGVFCLSNHALTIYSRQQWQFFGCMQMMTMLCRQFGRNAALDRSEALV